MTYKIKNIVAGLVTVGFFSVILYDQKIAEALFFMALLFVLVRLAIEILTD